MSENEKVIEKVLFDTDNLFQTAKYSKTRNSFIAQEEIEAIERKLVDEVLKKVRSGDLTPGRVEKVWGTYFVIDKIAGGTTPDNESTASDCPEYCANFFVRLGRAPFMRVV